MFMDPDATGTPDPSPRLSSRGVAPRLGGPDQRHAERDIMSRFFTGVDRLLPFRHGFIEGSQLELERLLQREAACEQGRESRGMRAAGAVGRGDGKALNGYLDFLGAVEEEVDGRLAAVVLSASGAGRSLPASMV